MRLTKVHYTDARCESDLATRTSEREHIFSMYIHVPFLSLSLSLSLSLAASLIKCLTCFLSLKFKRFYLKGYKKFFYIKYMSLIFPTKKYSGKEEMKTSKKKHTLQEKMYFYSLIDLQSFII